MLKYITVIGVTGERDMSKMFKILVVAAADSVGAMEEQPPLAGLRAWLQPDAHGVSGGRIDN